MKMSSIYLKILFVSMSQIAMVSARKVRLQKRTRAGEEIGQQIVQREDGTWLVDGLLSIREFRDLFGIQEIPGEKENLFQTLGGFIMAFLERIPKSGDHFLWGGYRFEVVDMDRRRVDKVLISPSHVTKDSDRLIWHRRLRFWK